MLNGRRDAWATFEERPQHQRRGRALRGHDVDEEAYRIT